MNAIDVERAAIKRLTGSGALARGTRVFTSDTLSDGDLAEMFSLPFTSGNTSALQDPTTGALYGMYNIDPYGSNYAP